VRVLAVVLVGAVLVLQGMGRRWWCACSSLNPFSFDVNSSHNSQHLLDPYSFTHVLHGLLLYALLWLVARRVSVRGRLGLALALEAVWELLENSPPIVARFRQTAVSFDYVGDSIFNSLGDLLSCGVGFGLAATLPVWGSVLWFVGTEVLLYLWIKDGLLLAFTSLLFPRR